MACSPNIATSSDCQHCNLFLCISVRFERMFRIRHHVRHLNCTFGIRRRYYALLRQLNGQKCVAELNFGSRALKWSLH